MNIKFDKIKKIKSLGEQLTIDIEVNHPDHNFYANGLITSNSHSISYSTMGYVSAYIKYHYPKQFFCSLLNYAQYEQKPIDEISEIISEFSHFDIKILPPSIEKINNKFSIEENGIRYPIGLIKGLGDVRFQELNSLSKTQLSTLDGFLESVCTIGLSSNSVESIIICGAVDNFGMSREDVLFYYWFLSELKPDILERFWIFKNGNPLSRELIYKFLEYREQVYGKFKQPDFFEESPKDNNKKIKYKSYFKTEATRIKTLEKTKEYDTLIVHYKKNTKFAYFLWEMYTMGFSYNYDFIPQIKTFKDIDSLHENDVVTGCGFVDEINFNISKRGNDYAKLKLKFDKKKDIMLFSEICESAKGLIKDNNLVRFEAKIDERGKLTAQRINVIDKARVEFEFYNKKKNENQNQNEK